MAKTPARRTAPRLTVVDGQPTTTSRDIAETFGRRHADVLERIRNLDCSKEFNERNFSRVEYTDAKGEQRTEYRITRDGFAFLCMGFTGAKAAQWKERYINTFNRMAERLAAKASRAVVKQSAVNVHAAPAIERSIDVRNLLLTGQSEAKPLPPELLRTINDRVWELMRELHPMLHEHIQRRIAFCAIHGQDVQPEKALAAIKGTTLGNALAGEHYRYLRNVQSLLEVSSQMALETAARIKGAA